MAAQLGAEIFARGFRFAPTPLEAATYYLPRLIAGAPLHETVRPVVHHADVYACEPGDLAAQFRPLPKTRDRFFFTSCKKGTRVAGPGSWNLQSSKAVMGGADQAEVVVGEIKKFKYKKGGVLTDWLMDEFSSTCCSEEPAAGDRQFVLCKIYVSPRALANSAARQVSAAFFAQRAPDPAVAMTQPAPKRPAPPQVSEPPCPKRMRAAVTQILPTMQPAGCTAYFAPPRSYYVPQTTVSVQPSPPVPTYAAPPNHSPAIAPPCPLAQMPPPILLPPMVRACDMPVQAPAHQYQPQPPVQTKQSTLDPSEAAAELGDEAEKESVAVTKQSTLDPFEAAELGDEGANESIAALDPAPDLDIDEMCRALEEDGELVRLFEDEDTAPTTKAEQAAANSEGSMMADGAPVPASNGSHAALPQCFDLDEIMTLPDDFFEYFKEFPVGVAEAFKVPQEAIQVT